jgi:hypothetical protein
MRKKQTGGKTEREKFKERNQPVSIYPFPLYIIQLNTALAIK